jgi:hypothetical protein
MMLAKTEGFPWEVYLGYLVVMAVVFGIGFLRHLYVLRVRRRMQDDIPDAARALEGEAASSPQTKMPFVRFRIGANPAFFIRWLYGEAKPVTTMEAQVLGHIWIEAGTRNRTIPWDHLPRMTDLRVSECRVRARDADDAEEWLNSGGDALLRTIGAWASAPFRVQIAPGRLVLEIERFVPVAELPRMRELVASLIGTLGPVESANIQILETTDSAEGVCQVCSAALHAPTKRCRSCKTPHHADCWTYLGKCSTFGCRGKETE